MNGTETPKNDRSRRGRKRLLRGSLLLVGTLIACGILTEVGLRHLMFGEGPIARRWGQGLRKPGLYSSAEQEDLFWKLRAFWKGDQELDRKRTNNHPALGWLSPPIDPSTLLHSEVVELHDRRPVLFFGDSFAQCMTAGEFCFQGVMEESDLSDRFLLLNYGVGGYGTDQAFLLLKGVVDSYVDRKPIVIFSFLVDDDMQRTNLHFRDWVKPYLEISERGLVNTAPPRHHETLREYFEANPIRCFSYSWRYLVHGTKVLPSSFRKSLVNRPSIRDRERRIHRQMFAEIKGLLDHRNVEFFFLLFHGRRAMTSPGLFGWREPFIIETLRELEIPFVSTRRDLLQACGGDHLQLERLFIVGNITGGGHYTAEGNAVAFNAFRRGLLGYRQTVDYEWPTPEDGYVPIPVERDRYSSPPVELIRRGRVKSWSETEDGENPQAGDGGIRLRVELDSGERAVIDYELDGRHVQCQAVAGVLPTVEGKRVVCSVRLTILADAEIVHDGVLTAGGPPVKLNVPTFRHKKLRIICANTSAKPSSGVLVIRRLKFQ